VFGTKREPQYVEALAVPASDSPAITASDAVVRFMVESFPSRLESRWVEASVIVRPGLVVGRVADELGVAPTDPDFGVTKTVD
jgi:hypothetical protein